MIIQFFPNFPVSKNDREVNRLRAVVSKINKNEDALRPENSAKLMDLTAGWKNHLARDHPLSAPEKYCHVLFAALMGFIHREALEKLFRSEFSLEKILRQRWDFFALSSRNELGLL